MSEIPTLMLLLFNSTPTYQGVSYQQNPNQDPNTAITLNHNHALTFQVRIPMNPPTLDTLYCNVYESINFSPFRITHNKFHGTGYRNSTCQLTEDTVYSAPITYYVRFIGIPSELTERRIRLGCSEGNIPYIKIFYSSHVTVVGK